MDYLILIALLLATTDIHAKVLQPGPEAIKESSNLTAADQNTQKRYATKEIILYLTLSQIQALKSGKNMESLESLLKTSEQQQPQSQLSFHEHDKIIRQQFENIKEAQIASEGQNQENVQIDAPAISWYEREQFFNEPQSKNLESVNIWSQDQPKIVEQPNYQYVYPKTKESKINENNQNQAQGENDGIPLKSVSEKKVEEDLLINERFQQWQNDLGHNKIQLKALSTLALNKNSYPQSLQLEEKPLLQLQYSPRYNDQKNAIEIEKLVRQHHAQELAKESALTQAEAIANSPPILIHHEVKITKHRPVPVFKQVKVEVPTPVLIPVPEPYEVKVPHPYPVPFKVIKHIPVPVIQSSKPFAAITHYPVSSINDDSVNVNHPYLDHKTVPLELQRAVENSDKSNQVTVIRYKWED